MQMKKKIGRDIWYGCRTALFLFWLMVDLVAVCGCGEKEEAVQGDEGKEIESQAEGTTGLSYETAKDGKIDFAVLQKENPDIFAWLFIPGTEVDNPILQSPVSDDFYKIHAQDGKEDPAGAIYTEMPNMMNMCDFNTVIHGKDEEEDDPFISLHRLEEPDFFEDHEKFYIYLPDNVLTYEIFAVYNDEGSDILRRFDYTTYAGCQAYLEQIYTSREMGKQLREGWEDLKPYHFLVTLSGSIQGTDGKQFVVIGVLIDDAAGQIDRVILN